MKRLILHLLFIVVFIAQSSAAIAMATHMQIDLPATGSSSGTHCPHHAMQTNSDNTDCQHCAQNDCSHCHCLGSANVITVYLPMATVQLDAPQYAGLAPGTVPDTPRQRILRPPRFIA